MCVGSGLTLFYEAYQKTKGKYLHMSLGVSTFTGNSKRCAHSRSPDPFNKYAGSIVIGKADVFDGMEFSWRSCEIRS